jgi:diacylglycerol kinase (ATP)
LDLLNASGMAVQSLATEGPGTAGAIARRAIDRGADLILVAGGDGTINEVANGMALSEVPLGVLPAGTANVLATELRLGKTMERAAESLAHSVKERVAMGLISNGTEASRRHFLMMTGAGLDADIVYHLHLPMKDALGKVAYWIGGFSKLGKRFPEFTVEANGREYRASFALASRVRNYGGDLEIAPTISLLDDEFELVLFEGENSFTYLKYMLGVLTHRLRDVRGVNILRTRQATISAPASGSVHLQVDGEYSGVAPARVEIVPNALTLLVPPSFRARRPATVEDAQWTTSPTR